MNRLRKILVPVNFSDDSASGLNYAASLAEETQAELLVLHVAKAEEARSFLGFLAVMEGWPTPNTPPTISLDRLVREKALDLYHFIETVIRQPSRVKIRRKIALGYETEKILGTARDENVDLVVLGMRKQSFLSCLIARVKFLNMALRLPCPVLLKPTYGTPWPRVSTYYSTAKT
jgi:nucleotide-binding universal stress UspA family protein